MKCPKCGLDNDDGAKFCKSCGASLESSPQGEKSSKNTLIIAVTAIICICIIAGAFIMVSGNNSNDSVAVNESDTNSSSELSTSDSSSESSNDNSDRYSEFSASEWPESSYTINDIYTAHTPEDAKTKMFEQADFNGDGVLTGDEIKEMDYLLKHSEYTYNGPGDTSSSSSSSSEKHWYGQCTTHGWVMLNSDKHCPYCIEEGLDPRVLKNSIVYE